MDEARPAANVPRLGVFHHLPSGGGVRVAGQLLSRLSGRFEVRVHCPEGAASLGESGLDVREWPFRAGRRLSGLRRLAAPLTAPARLRALERLCSRMAGVLERESDVVLVHGSMLVAAPPLLRYLEVPAAYFCYEYPRHIYEPDVVLRARSPLARLLLSPLRRAEARMDRESVEAAGRVLTLSGWMARLVGTIYGRSAEVVSPGVDLSFFRPGPSPPSRPYVLSVGALWPFKGHGMAVETLGLLPEEERPGLVVVGDRELPGYRERLEEEAGRRGVRLEVLRGAPDGRVRELYRGARAVLCCQHREPYGLVPLEGMACGTPVIAVREGGFTESVVDGRNGLLVARRPEDMAEALSRVMSDPGLRHRMLAGGVETVTVERTLDGAAGRLGDILMSMAREGGR